MECMPILVLVRRMPGFVRFHEGRHGLPFFQPIDRCIPGVDGYGSLYRLYCGAFLKAVYLQENELCFSISISTRGQGMTL